MTARNALSPSPSRSRAKTVAEDFSFIAGFLAQNPAAASPEGRAAMSALKRLEKAAGSQQTAFAADFSGTFRLDAKGRCVAVTRRFATLCGRKKAECVGMNWLRAVHTKDRKSTRDGWNKARKAGRRFTREFRITPPGGEPRWVRCEIIPERDSNTKICGYRGLFAALDRLEGESIELRTALNEAQDEIVLLRDAFESIPARVAVIDRNERFVLLSKEIRENNAHKRTAMGKSLTEVVTAAAKEGIDTRFTDNPEAHIRNRLKDYRAPRTEYVYPRKGGRWIKAISQRTRLGQIVALRIDITDQKKREEKLEQANAALAESEHRFRTLVENANLGIVVKRGLKPIFVNRSFVEMYGYDSAEEILSLRSSRQLLSPRGKKQPSNFKARQQGLPTSEDVVFNARRKDGSEFWSHQRSFPVRWDGEEALCSIRKDISDEMRAQDELRKALASLEESERRFRTLVENADTGIMVLRKLKPVYVNDEMARMYGYDSPEEILALKSSRELLAPSWKRVPSRYKAHRRGEETELDQVKRAQRKDGSEFWCLQRWFSIEWDGKEAMCSIRTDVTESKEIQQQLIKTNEELRHANALMSAVFDNMPMALVVRDHKLRNHQVNTAYKQWYDIDEEEFLGRPIRPSHDRKGYEHQMSEARKQERQVLRDGKIRSRSVRRRLGDGNEHDLELTKFPIRDEHGKIRFVGTLGADITPIRDLEHRLTDAIESLKEGFALFDKNDELVIANREFIKQRPNSNQIVKPGVSFKNFLKWNLQNDAKIHLDGSRARSVFKTRMKMHRDPGSAIEVALSNGTHLLVGERKTRDGSTVLTSWDITELREAEAVLATVQRRNAMGEVAAALAHEINQPLYAIMNYTNGLLNLLPTRDEPDGELLRSALEEIHIAGSRATEIITHVRNLVRNGAVERKTVDLREVIERSISFCSIGSKKALNAIRSDIRSSCHVLASSVELEQVFTNVIRNALEATAGLKERAPRIDISAKPGPKDRWTVSVSDNGTGIAEADRENLMQAFFTTKKLGMGMGLNVSRRIIRAHHGDIRIEPNAVNGVTVTVTLPASTLALPKSEFGGMNTQIPASEPTREKGRRR